MNRLTYSLVPLALALAANACIMDKELGATDSAPVDSEGETAGTATTAQDTDGASMTATMASTPSTGTPDTDVAEVGPITMSSTSPSDSGSESIGTGPVAMCTDWTPPPIECVLPGEATANVDGDSLPTMVDEMCTIAAIQNVDASTDAVTIDCAGEESEVQIATSNPHLDLPFSIDQEVLVSGAPRPSDALQGVRSFTIRATTGELLLAWLNQIDYDEDNYEPDVDIAPVVFNPVPSGCQPSDQGELCEADGALMVQRVMLEFGNGIVPIDVFDGNQAIVPADTIDMSVIVAAAQEIVCWDDDCAADDSGPWDETRLLLVALPSG
jgi:hypothetical protein